MKIIKWLKRVFRDKRFDPIPCPECGSQKTRRLTGLIWEKNPVIGQKCNCVHRCYACNADFPNPRPY